MNTKINQKADANGQRTAGNYWMWLSLGIVLLVAALAIRTFSRTEVNVPVTGSSSRAQTVPDAAAQGVAGYIEAHSGPSAQTVPDAGAQGVTNYLQAHSTGPIITEPAAKSVMDYLKAHGIDIK